MTDWSSLSPYSDTLQDSLDGASDHCIISTITGQHRKAWTNILVPSRT